MTSRMANAWRRKETSCVSEALTEWTERLPPKQIWKNRTTRWVSMQPLYDTWYWFRGGALLDAMANLLSLVWHIVAETTLATLFFESRMSRLERMDRLELHATTANASVYDCLEHGFPTCFFGFALERTLLYGDCPCDICRRWTDRNPRCTCQHGETNPACRYCLFETAHLFSQRFFVGDAIDRQWYAENEESLRAWLKPDGDQPLFTFLPPRFGPWIRPKNWQRLCVALGWAFTLYALFHSFPIRWILFGWFLCFELQWLVLHLLGFEHDLF